MIAEAFLLQRVWDDGIVKWEDRFSSETEAREAIVRIEDRDADNYTESALARLHWNLVAIRQIAL